MSFSEVWPDKSNGQTITAPELNQLKAQQALAIDKTGDTVPGLITFDVNIGYTPRTVDRERFAWESYVDSITSLPHFGRTSPADINENTFRQLAIPTLPRTIGQILTLPHGCTVTEISCKFKPAGGHLNLPDNQPLLLLLSRPILGGVASSSLSAQNIKANVADYNNTSITAIGTGSEVIDLNTNAYWLEFVGEYGANALTGLIFQGASIKLEITEQDVA